MKTKDLYGRMSVLEVENKFLTDSADYHYRKMGETEGTEQEYHKNSYEFIEDRIFENEQKIEALKHEAGITV